MKWQLRPWSQRNQVLVHEGREIAFVSWYPDLGMQYPKVWRSFPDVGEPDYNHYPTIEEAQHAAEGSIMGWKNFKWIIAGRQYGEVFKRERQRRDGNQFYFELERFHVGRSYYANPIEAMQAAEEAFNDCLGDLIRTEDILSRTEQGE